MPIITKLAAQKKSSRVNIFLDSRFALGISLDEVVKNSLQVGQFLTQTQVESLVKSSQWEKIYHRVLNFLSFRPRTEKEIKDYLRRKLPPDFAQKFIAQVIIRLKEEKLIDDLEFANWWLDQRQTHRPKGKLVLGRELKQKGICREIIDQVLAKINPGQEIILAKKLLAKKERLYCKLPLREQKQKLYQQLLRAGFSWEITKKVVDEKLKKEYN